VRWPDGPAGWEHPLKKFREITVEYLAEITTTIPEGTDPAGEMRSLGIWQAADDAEFQAIMAGLPLHRWMTVKATPLTPHPNNPGPAGTA
jgi:hypothetical protein